MTLAFKLDLDKAKVNHHVIYPGQRSIISKVIVRIHRHTWDQLLCLDH